MRILRASEPVTSSFLQISFSALAGEGSEAADGSAADAAAASISESTIITLCSGQHDVEVFAL
ncbi:MAG TPA: hypothetical protein VNT42_08295, partial [Sphingomonas sp.]|nr:hypothetical protein [Sphingomonas sp.]